MSHHHHHPELCAWFIANAVEGTMPALSFCQQCPCTWTPGRRHLRWTLASDPVRLARFLPPPVVVPPAVGPGPQRNFDLPQHDAVEIDLCGDVPLIIFTNRIRPVSDSSVAVCPSVAPVTSNTTGCALCPGQCMPCGLVRFSRPETPVTVIAAGLLCVPVCV